MLNHATETVVLTASEQAETSPARADSIRFKQYPTSDDELLSLIVNQFFLQSSRDSTPTSLDVPIEGLMTAKFSMELAIREVLDC